MFRPIRRKTKALGDEAAKRLLHTERRGVLAVHGDDGYPYAVPVNFFYDEAAGRIYFHGSLAGHKADAIRACDKVCFTVYGGETVRNEAWAPYVQSTVVFGRCRMRACDGDAAEKLRRFAMKYYPEASLVEQEIAKSGKAVQLYEITVEHITGKEIQER